MNKVLIGTCGFQKSRKLHYDRLDVVELQQTFYNPPNSETLRKWRKEAPSHFEFTVKAWMLITHEYNKKLWSRLKRDIPGKVENYGSFKATDEVLWAWKETLRSAIDVKSKIIVFQTPASFKPEKRSLENLINFIEVIKHDIMKHDIKIAWEPRGEWWNKRNLLEKISVEHNLIIVGDILKNRLIESEYNDIVYMRLHGLGSGEVNY
ncbi:MAG: DUF72 domain-containing protein, partial [Desulfurococcales archaeon]|nr:DUF72 domain-containing protein [Desulfurococcales archaeon]